MRTTKNLQQNGHLRTVFFSGGGTGGHVYPGIAVLNAFEELANAEKPAIRSIWIGTRGGMERNIVESRGIRYIAIPSGKLRRYFSVSNLVDVFKVATGIIAAFFIMKRYRPLALFTKGGYVSVPPVIGAKLAGVPVITHESDFDPGLATRINARFALKIAVSFAETREYFSEEQRRRVIVTGNPVRAEVITGNAERGLGYLAFARRRPLLLVLGGSQGAREINRLLRRELSFLLENWNVVHQTGADRTGPGAEEGYRRYDYIYDEYGHVLAAADLVLCRAGATTLWELAAARKPSILVPLGTGASRGDQIRNAELFRKLGASVVLGYNDEDDRPLTELAGRLLEKPEKLRDMASQAASIFKPDAAKEIAEALYCISYGVEPNER